MLRKYRIAVVAATGWLILCGAKPPTENGQRQGGDPQTAPSTQPAPTPAPIFATNPAVNFTPYPDYKSEGCYRAKDQHAADLCAEWRSAVAAEEAAKEARRAHLWTIIAAALNLATVIGLIVTILQGRGALAEAQRGNTIAQGANDNAARQAVEAAKDTARAIEIAERNAAAAANQVALSEAIARRQLRAYMGTPGAFISDPSFPRPKVVIDIKNFGQTPAYDLTAALTMNLDQRQPAGGIRRTVYPDIPTYFGICEPGHTQHVGLEIDRPIDPNAAIGTKVELTLSFRDVFDTQRWRRATYELTGTSGWIGEDRFGLSVADQGNAEGEGDAPPTELVVLDTAPPPSADPFSN